EYRPDVRRFSAGLEQPTSLHDLMPRIVYCDARVVDRSHQGELVGVRGHPREDLADLDAGDVGSNGPVGTANLRRRLRLHVPRVELARSADEEQADAVDVLVAAHRAARLQREQVRERQPQPAETERPGVKKVAPREPVAEMDGLLGVELDHGASGSTDCNWGQSPGSDQLGDFHPAWP